MGLSKSKSPKTSTPATSTFPNQQPGFPTSNQSQFGAQQQQPQQQPGPQGFNPTQSPFASQPNPFPSQSQGFSAPQTTSFPPFPAPPTQQLPGFPNNSLFNHPPTGFNNLPSSGFPVTYPSQPFRPLIPGYAPAPGNDRRVMGHVQEQQQEPNDYSNRYYGEQQVSHLVQMPQMHSVKPRKH